MTEPQSKEKEMRVTVQSKGGKKIATMTGEATFNQHGIFMPHAVGRNYRGPICWPWKRISSVEVAW
jgi:hypothetical protein